jgi:23S rRNA (cytidine1920-2'-O)/16S rRNA (cytidine1409-2'-O)-methyltransferase
VIAEGLVTVAGAVADKPARLVSVADAIVVQGPARPYVSRGGEKLAAGLDGFGITVDGLRVLDAGASTGGFTDCVLQRGAQRVIAVDVGYGQMHERLRGDGRIDLRERTNIRTLDADAIGGPVDLVVADLSFISLRLVLPALTGCARDDADLLPMVKPQFEVGRERLGAGGVVRDRGHRADAVLEVATSAAGLGWGTAGVVASPLPGPAGNVEFFLWLRRDASPPDEDDIRRAVEAGPA